jgi:hypothetical protein
MLLTAMLLLDKHVFLDNSDNHHSSSRSAVAGNSSSLVLDTGLGEALVAAWEVTSLEGWLAPPLLHQQRQ